MKNKFKIGDICKFNFKGNKTWVGYCKIESISYKNYSLLGRELYEVKILIENLQVILFFDTELNKIKI